MKRTVLIFAALIIALLTLFQLSKYSYASGNISVEIIIACIAVVFFFIGNKINKRGKTRGVADSQKIDEKRIEQLGLSKREYQVLLKFLKVSPIKK